MLELVAAFALPSLAVWDIARRFYVAQRATSVEFAANQARRLDHALELEKLVNARAAAAKMQDEDFKAVHERLDVAERALQNVVSSTADALDTIRAELTATSASGTGRGFGR